MHARSIPNTRKARFSWVTNFSRKISQFLAIVILLNVYPMLCAGCAAFWNTALQVWTDCKDIVKQGAVISVAVNHLEHIKKEIAFNCFNYSRGLVAVNVEEIPSF